MAQLHTTQAMTKDEAFINLVQTTREFIKQQQLGDVISMLKSMTELLPDATKQRESLADIDSDYARLLDFVKQGGKDPDRQLQQTKLIQRAIVLLQDLRRHKRLLLGTDNYSKTYLRVVEQEANDFIEVDQTDTDDCMFDTVWTSGQMPTSDVRNYMSTNGWWCVDNQYLASALTMALLEYFDPNKLAMLLELSSSDDTQVRVKAILGIAVTAEFYADLIPFFPQLKEGIERICQQNPKDFRILQQQVCLILESEKLQKQFKDEIIPNVIEAHRHDMPNTPGTHEVKINLSKNDPSLNKTLRRQIGNSFNQMGKLLSDGIDPSPGAFDDLNRLSFFSRISHWLRPYSPQLANTTFADKIRDLGVCNTDKYAMAFFLKSMPDELVDKVFSQITRGESNHQADKEDEDKKLYRIWRNAVQDITRLLRHSQWNGSWPDVLSNKVLYAQTPLLQEILSKNMDYLNHCTATFIKYNQWSLAKHLLQFIHEINGADVSTLLSLAMCEQEEESYQQAVRHIRMADALQPDNVQILQMLQMALEHTSQSAARIDVLRQLQNLQPDNMETTLLLANCLIRQNQWQDAIQLFYKLEFSGQHENEALRGVAWCALMQNKLSTAHKYYNRILAQAENLVTWEDHLNSGHTAWMEGDIPMALEHYSLAVKIYLTHNPKATNALKPFDSDRETLIQLGVPASDIGLMHDLIARTL